MCDVYLNNLDAFRIQIYLNKDFLITTWCMVS